MNATDGFLKRLRRRRVVFRLGLAAAEGLRLAGAGALALAGLAAADFFLAFSPRVLAAADAAAAAGLGALALAGAWRVLRVSARAVAVRADRDVRSARRDVLSAWELAAAGPAPDAAELHRYLVERSLARGEASLARLSIRQRIPWPELRRRARVFALQAGIALAMLGGPRDISRVVLGRILDPFGDHPPFSRYRFTVFPEEPRVLYGGSLEVSAEIAGPPVRSPVLLATRRRGAVQSTACFREGARRFTQRLERMVEPVEFRFETGRARTPWRGLEILLEPKVVAARLRVTPPAYARRPAVEFMAGGAKLAGLKGSQVELDLTSNRPLRSGELRLVPADGGEPAAVAGDPAGPHRMRFRWAIEQSAGVEVAVWDVQGTRNQEPFRLEQTRAPDAAPAASIVEPAGGAVATPRAVIPLRAVAEDDLGLARVDLVRTVAGFRDRARPLGPDAPAARLEAARSVDLGALGVEPGQELEFYVEAFDTNPDFAGAVASDIARVRIISEADYAAMLRARTDAEAFAARFRGAERTLRDLAEGIRRFREDLTAGRISGAERDRRWAELREATRRAEDVMRRMAADIELFDVEKAFHEELGRTADTLAEHDRWMGEALGDLGMQRTADSMLRRLKPPGEAVAAHAAQAEDIVRIAKLMEEARRFLGLFAAQERIVRRLERGGDAAVAADRRWLGLLADRQAEAREGLAALRDALREKARVLPDDLRELRDSALAFAAAIDEREIPNLMQEAETGGRRHDGRQFRRQASLALERMRELLSGCKEGGFGGMCDGEIRFAVSDVLRRTLEQMCAAWGLGAGRSGAGLAGGGGPGDANDGYWGGGYSLLNLPAYGPARTVPAAAAGAGGGEGGGAGASAARVDASAREVMPAAAPLDMRRETVAIDGAPLKYRGALKRYFDMREPQP